MNRKLKRTALIINQHIGIISEGLCVTEDWRKAQLILKEVCHNDRLWNDL